MILVLPYCLQSQTYLQSVLRCRSALRGSYEIVLYLRRLQQLVFLPTDDVYGIGDEPSRLFDIITISVVLLVILLTFCVRSLSTCLYCICMLYIAVSGFFSNCCWPFQLSVFSGHEIILPQDIKTELFI